MFLTGSENEPSPSKGLMYKMTIINKPAVTVSHKSTWSMLINLRYEKVFLGILLRKIKE